MTNTSPVNSMDEPEKDALRFAIFDQLVLPGGDVESCLLTDKRPKKDSKELKEVVPDISIPPQPNWTAGMDQTEPPFRKRGARKSGGSELPSIQEESDYIFTDYCGQCNLLEANKEDADSGILVNVRTSDMFFLMSTTSRTSSTMIRRRFIYLTEKDGQLGHKKKSC